jgi:hypothetical protein
MSLWTPDGERPVRRSEPAGGPGATPSEPVGDEAAEARRVYESLTDEQRAEAEALAAEMAEVRAQIAASPASVIVANHLMGLYELAAIHLSQQPPKLDDASLAIDAMTAVIERCRGRLGEPEQTLRDALSQLQLAYVQLQAAE